MCKSHPLQSHIPNAPGRGKRYHSLKDPLSLILLRNLLAASRQEPCLGRQEFLAYFASSLLLALGEAGLVVSDLMLELDRPVSFLTSCVILAK